MDGRYSTLRSLLNHAVERELSDLHLRADGVWGRADGILCRFEQGERVEDLIRGVLSEYLREDLRMAFEQGQEVDFSFEHTPGERFRGNLFRERGTLALSLRRIAPTVRTLEELGLPVSLRDLTNIERGLVLIAGATGSGKTTTAAALLDQINSKIPGHIITIEDPIEVAHAHKRCLVSQREVGRDTPSFSSARNADENEGVSRPTSR